ncbi:leucine-rich repeat-containing protein 56-like isoform X1 [Mizuhopecten yessoensis]|uniref:Leucine-rich repeat-containing protein 56 n=1 Tax=Mizuhopecten yessoensis TaxID=6573 RepID=A0A210QPM3_MIZYE|nr:leucine-rich repeat-containing protein 56-like isoform X1 [Mizuhopecten yessoensis]OWF50675.1 Leucine-rich repeat-containing protein 56 [Mizuhopecten yessoensis]
MALTQDTLCYRLQNMNSDFGVRPGSALARGVQITEFKDTRINPEPIILEDSDVLLEQYLSPGKLKLLTGVQNLEVVSSLQLKVDTSDTSLGNFGSLLPNLSQLRLSNSVIPCIRDLGSSLRFVKVLWMSRCSLVELDGVSSMSSLKELYLSYNEISDISPLSMLDKLQILDLEGNNLDDISQIQYLSFCLKLTNLTLEANPLCVQPAPDREDENYDYRQEVKKGIPHLVCLDDEPLSMEPSSKTKNVFDADWAFLEDLHNDLGLTGSMESLGTSDGGAPSDGSRPSSASLRPSTAFRPGSALRPSSGFRPLTGSRRPATTSGSLRPATARPSTGTVSNTNTTDVRTEEASSDLTLGKVICGNPSKALLSRRRITGPENKEATAPKMFPQFQHQPEHTYDLPPEDDRERSEITLELQAWKKDHEQRMIKIQETKAPQVLIVDHDDAISLSGEEITSDEDEEIDDDLGFSPLDADTTEEDHRSINHKMVVERLHNKQPANYQDITGSDHGRSVLDRQETRQLSESDGARPKSKGFVRPAPPSQPITGVRGNSPVRGVLRVNNSGLPRPPVHAMSTEGPSPPTSASGPSSIRRKYDRSNIYSEAVQPVIRGTSAAERPLPPSRPFTANAVLQPSLPSTQQRIRRTLPSVPSLPSRPPVPK